MHKIPKSPPVQHFQVLFHTVGSAKKVTGCSCLAKIGQNVMHTSRVDLHAIAGLRTRTVLRKRVRGSFSLKACCVDCRLFLIIAFDSTKRIDL